ncbi:precorrin-6A/cobalt-precorrin-6A reductase [Sulfitobacter sp. NFXS29]|uniref:precorrin-6A/cobalt-precorrin-6A reductase n=1 Tax=Sulfitobacter sp. NFXS29 TaxID=2818438 RepID=UPI0032DFDFA0
MTAPNHPSLNLLLLAGTAEARQLGLALAEAGHRVTAWLTEPPRGSNPMPMAFEMRDPDDTTALLRDMAGFDAVLDLSHGFDAVLSHAGFAAAAALNKPCVSFARPGWALDDPLLRSVSDVPAAASAVPPGARVFAATGWASLPQFLPFKGTRLMLRQTSRHDRPAPYDFVDLIFGDPPFTVATETALFRDLGVDLLICRNLGGTASRPKVDAALALGLPVILIAKPRLPEGAQCLTDLGAMMDWVAQL